MKSVGTDYPDNSDKKVFGKNSTDGMGHLFAVASIHQKLIKVHNSEKSLQQRWLSMPDTRDTLGRCDLAIPELDTFCTRRSASIGKRPAVCTENIIIESTLSYERLQHRHELDVVNYVYLGSLTNGPPLQQGLTLDSKGQLLLIRGKSKDLVKSSWLCLHGQEKYEVATVVMDDVPTLRFSRLCINSKGELIARKKHSSIYYQIEINTKDFTKEICFDAPIDIGSYIKLGLKKIASIPSENISLKFSLGNKGTVEFYFAFGEVCIKEVIEKDKSYNFEMMGGKLTFPLSKATSILSADRAGNFIKLCLLEKGKPRICYFSPRHVDFKTGRVRYLSHKPFQSFFSGTGGDPYEKVTSGLPFDSKRWGNFSSRNIPILSSVIDNFRVNLKQAKNHYYCGEAADAGLFLAKAVDPGVHCLVETTVEKIGSLRGRTTQETDNPLNHEMTRIEGFVNNKKLDKILSSSSGYFDNTAPLTEKLKEVLMLLAPDDSISFNKIKNTSFFFGIAAAGIPFIPGWFVGALARVLQHHSLTLTRGENGNITFSFIKNTTRSLVCLGGTGQGLEDKGKFLQARGIDYGTILPLEANIILAVNVESDRNFSFEIEWQHIDCFFKSLSEAVNITCFNDINIKNAILKKSENKNTTLLAEAKSEVRAQIGFMANPSTFLVVPRNALGLAVNMNFFDLSSNNKETITDFGNENISAKEGNSQIQYLNSSVNLFHEAKVMPIAMTGIGSTENKVMCYPLPLIEELNQRLPNTRNSWLRYLRLDGAFLQWKLGSLFETGDTPASTRQNRESEDATGGDSQDCPLHSVNQPIDKEMKELIIGIEQALDKAEEEEHAYQVAKPGASIGNFVLSWGDYKHYLTMESQSEAACLPLFTPEVKSATDDKVKPTTGQKVKRALMPWTRNTTLGEYLAQKARLLKSRLGSEEAPLRFAHDFVRSVEEYAARCDRHSNRKRSGIMAVATYRLQKHVLEWMREELARLCPSVTDESATALSPDEKIGRLRELSRALATDKSNEHPFYQLDTIELVRQNALMVEVSTLPCTIVHLARQNEVVYTQSLSMLTFSYRSQELFPYKMTSSLSIMPELRL